MFFIKMNPMKIHILSLQLIIFQVLQWHFRSTKVAEIGIQSMYFDLNFILGVFWVISKLLRILTFLTLATLFLTFSLKFVYPERSWFVIAIKIKYFNRETIFFYEQRSRKLTFIEIAIFLGYAKIGFLERKISS